MLLAEIAEVSQAVAATSARLAKIEMLAAALREAGPLEVPIAVAYLSGELPQRQIGVGWAVLRDGFRPAEVPTLGLAEVDAAFSAIGAVAGKGSAAARKALVGELFGRATAAELRDAGADAVLPDLTDTDAVVAFEQRTELIDAFRSLPRRQREVLALRYYLDMSVADAAATLRISEGAVRSTASRGLDALARALPKEP